MPPPVPRRRQSSALRLVSTPTASMITPAMAASTAKAPYATRVPAITLPMEMRPTPASEARARRSDLVSTSTTGAMGAVFPAVGAGKRLRSAGAEGFLHGPLGQAQVVHALVHALGQQVEGGEAAAAGRASPPAPVLAGDALGRVGGQGGGSGQVAEHDLHVGGGNRLLGYQA